MVSEGRQNGGLSSSASLSVQPSSHVGSTFAQYCSNVSSVGTILSKRWVSSHVWIARDVVFRTSSVYCRLILQEAMCSLFSHYSSSHRRSGIVGNYVVTTYCLSHRSMLQVSEKHFCFRCPLVYIFFCGEPPRR